MQRIRRGYGDHLAGDWDALLAGTLSDEKRLDGQILDPGFEGGHDLPLRLVGDRDDDERELVGILGDSFAKVERLERRERERRYCESWMGRSRI